MPDLDAAERFLAGHARVLERRRFARLFRDGPGAPVRDAVAAYRNTDGGFGHGLEPDGRGPASQPIAAAAALTALDAADAWDDALAAGVCDWLERTAPQEGGATFVLPDDGWPAAPYWQPTDGLRASPTTTGQIAAPLLRRGVAHPWLDRAADWLWAQAEAPGEPERSVGAGYDVLGLVSFLNATPEVARAEAALDGLADIIRAVTTEDPAAEEELQSPIVLAPQPGDRARRLFERARVEAFLDALDAGQRDDGGWTFPWLVWSPVAEADWRGVVTVQALTTLRANGRVG